MERQNRVIGWNGTVGLAVGLAVGLPAPGPCSPYGLEATPGPSRSYVRQHWNGRLPLSRAYWINYILVTTIWTLATRGFVSNGLAQGLGMRASGLASLAIFSFGVVLNTWSVVGVWRSAALHASRGGQRVWGQLVTAQVGLGVMCAVIIGVVQAPIIRQSLMLASGRDPIPVAQLHVVNGATEVEIAGGLSFGTADRLKIILDATPTIRLVQLNSSGGWIAEAVQIGRLVEERKLSTYSARGCDSACVVVFIAGADRLLGSNARLGFHEASVAGVGGEVASDGTQTIRKALARRGVPEAFITQALSIPASSIWFPTVQALMTANVITAVVDERSIGAIRARESARTDGSRETI